MHGPSSPQPLGVLVADDSVLVRNRLIPYLREIDGVGEIREAGTGSEALREIFARPPDILVLDVRMPGGTGLDVLDTLRSEDALPALVVVWTNFAHTHTRHRALAAGAHGFFDKSTQFQDMLLAIEAFIGSTEAA
ncbi:MAG: response regulator transcription factor [Longimicrobiales bacterium]